ncbi:hypothetical protein pA_gene0035 [Vibrio phage 13VT501A]|nr:hypothetical protein pA_gene0035 [Vibrio phage 13VT501A]
MKKLMLIPLALLLTACANKGDFYDDAELYNAVSGVYCENKARVMIHNRAQGKVLVVCNDGTRVTVSSDMSN